MIPNMEVVHIEQSKNDKGVVIVTHFELHARDGGWPKYVAVTYPDSAILTVYAFAGYGANRRFVAGRKVNFGPDSMASLWYTIRTAAEAEGIRVGKED